MLIESLEQLQNMREDDLSRDVLVQLFEGSGFRDVRFMGGGILEQGKDIVMWQEGALRSRTNFAVVVKSTPITGAAGSGGMVLTQLRQAFKVPFRDTLNGEEHDVHAAFVVTPFEIKKEGTETVAGLLTGEPFERYVTFIDGKELWRRVHETLGPHTILPRFSAAFRDLRRVAGESQGLSVQVSDELVTLNFHQVEPATFQHGSGVEIEPAAPANVTSPRDGGMKLEFVPAGFDPKTLEEIGHFARKLGLDPAEGTFTIGPAEKLVFRGVLTFRGKKGREVTIPYVELRGEEREGAVVITSVPSSNTPFWFELGLDLNNVVDATFSYRFDIEGATCHWLGISHKFSEMAANEGCDVFYQNIDTLIEHRLGALPRGKVAAPRPSIVNLVRDLVWIEASTQQPIHVPARTDLFTKEDIQGIVRVRTILRDGRLPLENFGFTMFVPKENGEALERFLAGDTKFQLTQAAFTHRVLDTDIDLGPATVEVRKGGIQLLSREPADGGENVTVRIAAGANARTKINFQSWPKRGTTR